LYLVVLFPRQLDKTLSRAPSRVPTRLGLARDVDGTSVRRGDVGLASLGNGKWQLDIFLASRPQPVCLGRRWTTTPKSSTAPVGTRERGFFLLPFFKLSKAGSPLLHRRLFLPVAKSSHFPCWSRFLRHRSRKLLWIFQYDHFSPLS